MKSHFSWGILLQANSRLFEAEETCPLGFCKAKASLPHFAFVQFVSDKPLVERSQNRKRRCPACKEFGDAQQSMLQVTIHPSPEISVSHGVDIFSFPARRELHIPTQTTEPSASQHISTPSHELRPISQSQLRTTLQVSWLSLLTCSRSL